jgi:hypothetical protein
VSELSARSKGHSRLSGADREPKVGFSVQSLVRRQPNQQTN